MGDKGRMTSYGMYRRFGDIYEIIDASDLTVS